MVILANHGTVIWVLVLGTSGAGGGNEVTTWGNRLNLGSTSIVYPVLPLPFLPARIELALLYSTYGVQMCNMF